MNVSKILEIEVPVKMAEKINEVLIKDHFSDESDFIRHCIRVYFNSKVKGKSKKKTNGIIIKKIIKEVQEELNDSAPREEIIIRGEEAGINKENVEDVIRQLRKEGDICETRVDKFKVV